jgi:hypothetical protein
MAAITNSEMEKKNGRRVLVANFKKTFKVCKSVHHHTIQINHQLDATISPVLLLDIYLQFNMFWASSRPSPGAQQLQ